MSITAATNPALKMSLWEPFQGCRKFICIIRFSPTKSATISSTGISRPKGKLDPFVLVMEGSIPNEKSSR